MSALDDEIVSINAIYGDGTLSPAADYVVLRVPNSQFALRLTFIGYPHSPPAIVGPESAGDTLAKGGAHRRVEQAKRLLHDCFHEGEPCIFDLIEGLTALEQEQHAAAEARIAAEVAEEAEGVESSSSAAERDFPSGFSSPSWIVSEVVTEKKSVFVARAAHVFDPETAKQNVRFLLATDKKASRATHNMTAWRIRQAPPSSVVYQDCDDDGETAAGGRLLHLLELMGLWNVMVVVTRWYGGVHLGPDRFRLINSVARDALVKAGMTGHSQDAKSKHK